MFVFDAEFDGLTPTLIHCLSIINVDSGNVYSTTDYDKMRTFFTTQEILIGHNITRFDIPHLERLLDIKIKAKLYDTLALSWYLYPERVYHGLASWGEDLGIKKPEIEDWFNLSVEEYIHRCEEDVKINLLLWKKQYRYLVDLYGKPDNVTRLLDYMHLKMYCAALQEKSGWKVDLDFAKAELNKMVEEKAYKTKELELAMPSVPVYVVKTKPKKYLNKDGSKSKLGQEWDKLLVKQQLPPDHEESIKLIASYDPPNSGSTPQIKDWLDSLGWKPQTFKYVKKDGALKAVPQINLGDGKGVCPSIKMLFEKEPRLEVLDGLSILSHRIPLLKGIVESVDKDGRTKAQIQGMTNTLRFKHETVVNLPKVTRPWGESIRGSLISDDGYILCGSDQSSLEDRIKQHYIYPKDPKYVDSMNQEDFDPHLIIAEMAGMMTKEEADAYKNGDKSKKPIRDTAKNGNYACQYGAGPPRLVITCNISLDQARKLHKAYWDLNWAITAVADELIVKQIHGQMWLFNPVSRLWYSLRTPKDKFSTLVQGTASYVFDKWVEKILNVRPQLTAQFHDEIVLEIKQGSQEKCKQLLNNCLEELNTELNLNRKLGIDVQFGHRYSDIH